MRTARTSPPASDADPSVGRRPLDADPHCGQTPVKTLHCPKLRLRAIIIDDFNPSVKA